MSAPGAAPEAVSAPVCAGGRAGESLGAWGPRGKKPAKQCGERGAGQLPGSPHPGSAGGLGGRPSVAGVIPLIAAVEELGGGRRSLGAAGSEPVPSEWWRFESLEGKGTDRAFRLGETVASGEMLLARLATGNHCWFPTVRKVHVESGISGWDGSSSGFHSGSSLTWEFVGNADLGGPCPRPTESQSGGTGPSQQSLRSPPGDSDVLSSLRTPGFGNGEQQSRQLGGIPGAGQ